MSPIFRTRPRQRLIPYTGETHTHTYACVHYINIPLWYHFNIHPYRTCLVCQTKQGTFLNMCRFCFQPEQSGVWEEGPSTSQKVLSLIDGRTDGWIIPRESVSTRLFSVFFLLLSSTCWDWKDLAWCLCHLPHPHRLHPLLIVMSQTQPLPPDNPSAGQPLPRFIVGQSETDLIYFPFPPLPPNPPPPVNANVEWLNENY